jgi:hypothetical protein
VVVITDILIKSLSLEERRMKILTGRPARLCHVKWRSLMCAGTGTTKLRAYSLMTPSLT